MSWAVEEYCEDSIVTYLTAKIAATMKAYVGWTDDEPQFPCVVVHAGESDNVGDTEFNGARQIAVNLAVMTEAVASGATSARTRNRTARDEVLTALARDDLAADLNTQSPTPAGVVFSRAMLGASSREVEADKRVFITNLTLNVIASSKAIT